MSQLATKEISLPAWCINEYSEQVKQLQTELEQRREVVRAETVRIEYINRIFDFCSKAEKLLDLTDAAAVNGVQQILELLGLRGNASATEPQLLQLNDDANGRSFVYVVPGGGLPERTHLAGLVKAQTDEWLKSGVEPKSLLLYDEELSGPLPADLKEFSSKRGLNVITTRALLRSVAEILMKEADPDDVREMVLSGSSTK